LAWFWYRYGHFSSGRRQLEQALGLADASERDRTRAAALHALGWLCFLQGEWNRAEALYRESLELYRNLGDRPGEVTALSDLGVARRWLGQEEEGNRDVQEAVRLAREQGDPLRLAVALIWAYATTGGRFRGEVPRAELQEAVDLSRGVGDLWCIAHALNGLGDLFRGLGKPAAARPLYEEALKGFRRLKDRWMTAWTLEGLGMVNYLAGGTRRAAAHFREAIALFDLLGDKGNAAFLLSRLGLAAHARAAHPRAARLLGAFEGIQEALLGREAAARVEHPVELGAVMAEYRSQQAAHWATGRAMSYEQAVAFALKPERR
jgi:tetratricopeptide (TPR) repeat protein